LSEISSAAEAVLVIPGDSDSSRHVMKRIAPEESSWDEEEESQTKRYTAHRQGVRILSSCDKEIGDN
jgi:hypothetical protein